MSSLNFESEIEIRIGNPYILVSKEQAEKIKKDWKKPLPVLIQISGEPNPPWKINMMPVGNGDFYLYLHGDVRKASNTKVGDIVNVSIEFDKNYKNGPLHEMPTWFKNALNKNSLAQDNWNKLTPSRQKEVLRYFSWLKSDKAVQRNLDKMMSALTNKEVRFMARNWKNGK